MLSGKPPIWLPVRTKASRAAVGAKLDRCREDSGGRVQARKNSDNGVRPTVRSLPRTAQNLTFRSEASTRVGLLDDAYLSALVAEGFGTAVVGEGPARLEGVAERGRVTTGNPVEFNL